MIELCEEQEKKELWRVYKKVDIEGRKSLVKMANNLLAFQLLSEGKKSPKEKIGRAKNM